MKTNKAPAAPARTIALVTGITGQDDANLAEFLLGKDYVVYGALERYNDQHLFIRSGDGNSG